MKPKSLFFLILLILPCLMHGQEDENNFGIHLGGFVKSDFFYDSRQTVAAREGHFLLWPAAENLGASGEDINAVPNFNFLAIQTRLKGTITGPDAFGAKTSGVIEGAFFGHTNADINGFRLRHAFVKFKWDNTAVLAGQYWHPMFVTGCFPGTVSFNTGAPFQPFSRNPQLRVTHYLGNLSIIAAALSHRDFVTAAGSAGLRNSGLPDINLQLHYTNENKETNTAFLAGVGAEHKTIVPRLESQNYKIDESVSSSAAMAFAKVKLPALTFKLEGVYGQNLYDLLMINSFASTRVVNPATGEMEYTSTNLYSVWTDIHTNGKTLQAGLFAGYTANRGSGEFESPPNTSSFAGTRHNIANVMRVAPRIIFNSGKARFSGELEYTSAAFGDGTFDSDGVPLNTTTASNVRFLLGVYYFF